MREDYGSIPMSIHDEGFGDMAFDDADFIRDDPNVDENLMDDLNADELHTTDLKEPRPGTSRSLLDLDHHGLGENDGFGDGDGFGEPAAGLFEGDMFADAPLDPVPELTEAPADADSDDDMDGGRWDAGPPSTAPSSPIEFRPTSPVKSPAPHNSRDTSGGALRMSPEPSVEPHGDNMRAATDDHDATAALNQSLDSADAPPSEDHHLEAPDQTTLLHNEEESFALAPVDASALRGVTKAKRKRKLIVDEVKNISGEEMKSQLANTSDIITTLDLAPPTKRLMYWKDTGGVEKMFTLCSRDIKARVLFKVSVVDNITFGLNVNSIEVISHKTVYINYLSFLRTTIVTSSRACSVSTTLASSVPPTCSPSNNTNSPKTNQSFPVDVAASAKSHCPIPKSSPPPRTWPSASRCPRRVPTTPASCPTSTRSPAPYSTNPTACSTPPRCRRRAPAAVSCPNSTRSLAQRSAHRRPPASSAVPTRTCSPAVPMPAAPRHHCSVPACSAWAAERLATISTTTSRPTTWSRRCTTTAA